MPLVPAPHQTVARLLHLQVIRWNLLPPADAEDLEAARDSRRRPPGASCGYIYGKRGGRSTPGFWQAKNWGSSGYTPKKYLWELEMIWFNLFFFKKPLVVSELGKLSSFIPKHIPVNFQWRRPKMLPFKVAPGSFQCPQSAWSTALPRGRSKAGRFDNTKPGGKLLHQPLGADVTFPLGMMLELCVIFVYNMVSASPSKELDLYPTYRVLT